VRKVYDGREKKGESKGSKKYERMPGRAVLVGEKFILRGGVKDT